MLKTCYKSTLNITEVWLRQQVWPEEGGEGSACAIIRHAQFRLARAPVLVSLPHKLAAERMYSNNESSLPDQVKRDRLQRTTGAERRENQRRPSSRLSEYEA